MLKVVNAELTSTRIDVDSRQELEDIVRRLHESGVPDSEIHIERGCYPVGEVTDTDMARSMRLGVLVGVPLVYLLSGIISLLAGLTLGEAALVGIIPALFGGWFVAGFVLLNARTGEVETRRHTTALHEIDEIVVTGSHAAIAATVTEETGKAA